MTPESTAPLHRIRSLHDALTLPCGLVLPNRLMKSALSEGLATADGGPDDQLHTLYRRWGMGGYGLIVTGNVMIDRRQLGEPGNVAIEDHRHLDELARWAKVTQDGGSPIWMQINHPGRQANPVATGSRPVAPSAVSTGVPGFVTPRAMTPDEIEEVIARFVMTARVAESAGFDGVQVHGAHGYLVSQFLSPLANQRDDAWGGDPLRRRRFLLEVVRAIRHAVSPSFGVGVKLNSADFQRGGFTEADARDVVGALAAEHIDLLEISGGTYASPAMTGRPDTAASASTRAREAYFLDFATAVRGTAGAVPLAVTGGFRTETAMSAALADGACDIVGIGRPTITVPDAATALLGADEARLQERTVALTLPAPLRRLPHTRTLEGALELQWHTDQLHRMGRGADPDPGRGWWATSRSAVRRNGIDAFRGSRRRNGGSSATPSIRKFRIERFVGRHLANPLVRGMDRIGLRSSLITHIETTGRRTGLPRTVPVAVSFDESGAWVISQHGTTSGWGSNITANPEVRLRRRDGWVEGTATFAPDDDVAARAASMTRLPLLRHVVAASFRTLQTTPVSVRVDFASHQPTTPERPGS